MVKEIWGFEKFWKTGFSRTTNIACDLWVSKTFKKSCHSQIPSQKKEGAWTLVQVVKKSEFVGGNLNKLVEI